MLLRRALTAVLLISRVSSVVVVPPPTNVTVTCQNLKTTASWNYNKQQLETIFSVNIDGCDFKRNFSDETKDCLYDLSHFLWQECYMDALYVTVTAIQGGNRSEAVGSNTFSYNDLKVVDTKCVLEFPPVAVNVNEEHASIKFQNPFHSIEYQKLNLNDTPNNGILNFNAISVIKEWYEKASCTVKQPICKLDIKIFPEGVEKCVKLEGKLVDRIGVNHIQFKETDQICLPKPTEKGVFLLGVILLGVFALLIITAIIVISIMKAWTLNPQPLPDFLQDQLIRATTVDPRPTTLCNIFLGGADSDSKPLAELERRSLENDSTSMSGTTEDTNSFVLTDISQTYAECSPSEDDEDEESVSPYDSPHMVMDMGDGDMVTAYRGK